MDRCTGVGGRLNLTEQAGFLDHPAGFDQAASAGVAPDVLFGRPSFLLFMNTRALSKQTSHR
jgi:hypothetical protein